MKQKPQKSEDSNNIQDIVNKKRITWKDLAFKLEERVKELEAEIVELRRQLESSHNVGQIETFILTDEEQIALMQLDRLKRIAEERALTLDETRQFDILVKNKRLAQGDSTTINGNAKSLNSIPETKLLKIASQIKLKEKNE